MKNNFKRLFVLLTVAVFTCSALFACNTIEQEEITDDQPNTDIPEINNQENEDKDKDDFLSEDNFSESPLLSSSPYLHGSLAVIENKIKVIRGPSGLQEDYQIYDDQVITIKCDRYIFLKDGSIVDHKKNQKKVSITQLSRKALNRRIGINILTSLKYQKIF